MVKLPPSRAARSFMLMSPKPLYLLEKQVAPFVQIYLRGGRIVAEPLQHRIEQLLALFGDIDESLQLQN
jgi:hypothetical protein